jgi:hypothetical protein
MDSPPGIIVSHERPSEPFSQTGRAIEAHSTAETESSSRSELGSRTHLLVRESGDVIQADWSVVPMTNTGAPAETCTYLPLRQTRLLFNAS